MLRTLCPILLLSITGTAAAGDIARGTRPFEDCLGTALQRQPGRVIKVEFKIVDGRSAYEFDIQGNDGQSWDVECDADRASIVSVEREVDSAADPLFSAQAKVSEAAARKTVAVEHPGMIEEVEYEIEENGSASYEFDIAEPDGTQTKVEVDAASGKIIEVDRELWQVGFE